MFYSLQRLLYNFTDEYELNVDDRNNGDVATEMGLKSSRRTK